MAQNVGEHSLKFYFPSSYCLGCFEDWNMWQVSCDMWHVTWHTWCGVNILSLLIAHILKFILPIWVPTNFSKFISNFSNKTFVSRSKFLKTYSPSVFIKDGFKLFVFKSLKWKYKFWFENKIEKAWNLILRGYILAVTHFVTQFTHIWRQLKV